MLTEMVCYKKVTGSIIALVVVLDKRNVNTEPLLALSERVSSM